MAKEMKLAQAKGEDQKGKNHGEETLMMDLRLPCKGQKRETETYDTRGNCAGGKKILPSYPYFSGGTGKKS